jgi:hypothetical protein
VLSFNLASRHEGVLGEWRYSCKNSLISAIDGGEWSASRPGRFTHRERAPGTHWIGGWVGPRATLDAVVKRKILSPRRDSNHRPSRWRWKNKKRNKFPAIKFRMGSVMMILMSSSTVFYTAATGWETQHYRTSFIQNCEDVAVLVSYILITLYVHLIK